MTLHLLGRAARRGAFFRVLLAASLGLAGIGAVFGIAKLGSWRAKPLIEIVHLPGVYQRRTADLSANVVGRIHRLAQPPRFQVNDGPWRTIGRASPRTLPPLFTLEMPLEDLVVGANRLSLEAHAPLHPGAAFEFVFDYDPTPPRLPFTVDWKHADLDVQDGVWEKIQREGTTWVRPRPGYEYYDRILMVRGAFPADRTIETEMVFRHDMGRREFGFGVLTLWGGHPDDWSVLPRRGWSFALAWYWSKPGGAGSEISYKPGVGEPAWVNTYRNVACPPGGRHRVRIEIIQEGDAKGRHLRHRQRLKWWLASGREPDEWLELVDDAGSSLPPGEYGIALLAYHCQVEFGPVRIGPLGGP